MCGNTAQKNAILGSLNSNFQVKIRISNGNWKSTFSNNMTPTYFSIEFDEKNSYKTLFLSP